MHRVLGLLVPVLLVSSVAHAADPARNIILVRHAERAGGMSADVELSPEGRCRAGVLASVLADAGIKRIYTSEAVRTQQPAEPLANKLNIRPEVVQAQDAAGVVTKLRANAPSGAVLVVGHSNTVPDIIKRLGGGVVKPIEDNEFDRLFVVTLTGPNKASVVMLHYAGCPPSR